MSTVVEDGFGGCRSTISIDSLPPVMYDKRRNRIQLLTYSKFKWEEVQRGCNHNASAMECRTRGRTRDPAQGSLASFYGPLALNACGR